MISYPQGYLDAVITTVIVGILFIIFICFGVVTALKRQRAIRTWTRIEGNVLFVRGYSRNWGQGVMYSYAFEGRSYEGRDYVAFNLFGFNKKYKKGDAVELLVDPQNPSKSYMHTYQVGSLDSYTVQLIAFIVVIALMAVFLYYNFWLPYGQFLK